MFISSDLYDKKLHKIAGKILPGQELGLTRPAKLGYDTISPIKTKTFNDYVLEQHKNHGYQPKFHSNFNGFQPTNQPIIQRVFRPSVIDNLHSQQLLLAKRKAQENSQQFLKSFQENELTNRKHESFLRNLENSDAEIHKNTNENSFFPSEKPKKAKHHRKKSNSYHFGDNSSQQLLSNHNISPYFPSNSGFPNQNPYFNSENAKISQTEEIVKSLLEKYKKTRQKIQMQKSEQTQKLMQKMMKKQSELLKKLGEVRENNKRKREELHNEELRNKISAMEARLMFKKFEGNQMNFLLDLKNDLRKKINDFRENHPNPTSFDYSNSEFFKHLEQTNLFNAMTQMPFPGPNANQFPSLYEKNANSGRFPVLPPMNILNI